VPHVVVDVIAVTSPGSQEWPSLRGGRQRAVLQRALEAVWLGGVPVLLTVLTARYLIPTAGSGLMGTVAGLWKRGGLYSAGALFLVFTALARYWRDRLSAGGASPASDVVGQDATPVVAWRRPREALGLLVMVVAAVGAALALRAYVAKPYRVIGGSMLPTFEPEDLVLAMQRPYAPGDAAGARRGDIVVFSGAAVAGTRGVPLPDILVKRVVGLPGDLITMNGETPVINGWLVPGCDVGEYMHVLGDAEGSTLHGRLRVEFLDDRAYLTVHTMGGPAFPGSYRVKPGEVFVLGDDRGNSLDSRMYSGGRGAGVPASAVEGRVQWFLVGTHRSGDADFDRLLRPVDALGRRLRLEGLQTQGLEEGIAKCLATPPTETHPPPPNL